MRLLENIIDIIIPLIKSRFFKLFDNILDNFILSLASLVRNIILIDANEHPTDATLTDILEENATVCRIKRAARIEHKEHNISPTEKLLGALLSTDNRVVEARGVNNLHPLEILLGIENLNSLSNRDKFAIGSDIINQIVETIRFRLTKERLNGTGQVTRFLNKLLRRLNFRLSHLIDILGTLSRIEFLIGPLVTGIKLRLDFLLRTICDNRQRSRHRRSGRRENVVLEDESIEESRLTALHLTDNAKSEHVVIEPLYYIVSVIFIEPTERNSLLCKIGDH